MRFRLLYGAFDIVLAFIPADYRLEATIPESESIRQRDRPPKFSFYRLRIVETSDYRCLISFDFNIDYRATLETSLVLSTTDVCFVAEASAEQMMQPTPLYSIITGEPVTTRAQEGRKPSSGKSKFFMPISQIKSLWLTANCLTTICSKQETLSQPKTVFGKVCHLPFSAVKNVFLMRFGSFSCGSPGLILPKNSAIIPSEDETGLDHLLAISARFLFITVPELILSLLCAWFPLHWLRFPQAEGSQPFKWISDKAWPSSPCPFRGQSCVPDGLRQAHLVHIGSLV